MEKNDSSELVDKELEAGGPPQTVEVVDIDVAALAGSKNTALEWTPEMEARVRRKIDWHILPLMYLMSILLFADQTVVGQSAILGIFESTKMSLDEFNWLVTALYISFIIFEYPQSMALQRFPVAKWICFNVFLWSVALLAHAACKSFWALLWARVVLGAGIAVVMPGFMIVITMFYVHEEQTARGASWFMFGGLNNVLVGFLAFGLLHSTTPNFMPWQWMMIITGILTILLGIVFWFYFPDSPSTAWFLTEEERFIAVQRIKRNQTGIENKRWKKSQFMEALKDPKIYLFLLIGLVVHLPVGSFFQKQIIVNKFGFSRLETTLLGCIDGIVVIAFACLGIWLASFKWIGRAYAAMIMYSLPLLGSVLLNVLPMNNRIGLLFSYYLTLGLAGAFSVTLAWIPALVAGHTKRITSNAIFLIASNISSAAGPFMWKEKYQPRNRIPWIILAIAYLVCMLLTWILRTLLVWENRKRDNEPQDTTYNAVYITEEVDGKVVERRVDKAFLDLTDIENRDFRYVI